jgi:hypothetical protein
MTRLHSDAKRSRRSFERRELRQASRLIISSSGHEHPVEIRDLSAAGLGFLICSTTVIGRADVAIVLLDGTHLPGRMRWRRGELAGLEFDLRLLEPSDVGFYDCLGQDHYVHLVRHQTWFQSCKR